MQLVYIWILAGFKAALRKKHTPICYDKYVGIFTLDLCAKKKTDKKDWLKKYSLLRVDINKDRSVSAKEMQRWIMEKTEEHFQEAMQENKNSFRAVDPDGDGKRV